MFEKALKEAFETFINEDARPAQYLSLYIDDMLKKKLAGLTEETIEAQGETIKAHEETTSVGFARYHRRGHKHSVVVGQPHRAARMLVSSSHGECGGAVPWWICKLLAPDPASSKACRVRVPG